MPCAAAAAGQVNFCGRMRFGVAAAAATTEADTSKSQIGSEEEIPSANAVLPLCLFIDPKGEESVF